MPIDFNELAKQVEKKIIDKLSQLSDGEKEELLKNFKDKEKSNGDKK